MWNVITDNVDAIEMMLMFMIMTIWNDVDVYYNDDMRLY